MRTTSISIGAVVLVAACGESPTGPPRPMPATPSFAVDNGAHVARARDERSYADTVSSCGGEPIAVEATVVRREQIVFLPSGGLHHTYHVVVRMHGAGLTSGARYVGQISWIEASVYRGPDSGVPRTETRTIRLHGVTQGPTDNVFETITFETVYDEHGGNTVVIRGKAGCYG